MILIKEVQILKPAATWPDGNDVVEDRVYINKLVKKNAVHAEIKQIVQGLQQKYTNRKFNVVYRGEGKCKS